MNERRLIQLSLRDLFWLVLVVALCVGWWAEHQRQAVRLRDECSFQQWHFDIIADVLKDETGTKATVNSEGVTIRYPDGHFTVHVRPAQ